MIEQLKRDAARFIDIASPDSQLTIYHRRVVTNEDLLSGGRAITVDQPEGGFQQRFCECLGIRNGGRTRDELWRRAVEFAEPPQPSHDVAEVASIYAAIVMKLIDHNVFQVFKKLGPLGVMREDAAVQHIGIGEHNVGPLAYGAPRILGSVAIVGEGADVRPHRPDQTMQFFELIFRERLRREKIEGARAGLSGQTIEHGKVVAKGFTAGGGRYDDDIFAGGDSGIRFRLVRVRSVDTAGGKHLTQFRVHMFRKVPVISRARGGAANGPDGSIGIGRGEAFELLDKRREIAVLETAVLKIE